MPPGGGGYVAVMVWYVLIAKPFALAVLCVTEGGHIACVQYLLRLMRADNARRFAVE